VYGNQVVGIAIGNGAPPVSYQATINVGFQLSNVISGNGGNGIGLYSANNNQVAMNYVGTNTTGLLALGNAGNGIIITNNSNGNLIGGEATGGNNPTGGGDPADAVFVVPPQGNLISGNFGDGVLISNRASGNQLSGNFIGTNATGNAALGNHADGVMIDHANSNSLVGCTFQENPFVFYNVVSGNAGNGLAVNSSNNTTIQANFFGMGADNATAVGNTLNGVVVEGNSAHTTMGGPIPLGNVDSANGLNGIVLKDTASYFTSYNTFCGIAAFSQATTFGNGADGILITSTGGNNLLRTNVFSENDDDGIEISGNARDVRVVGNIVGLDTYGFTAMGNAGSGIKIGGAAHDILIGGPEPVLNVIPQNTISANAVYGIDLEGTAYHNTINYSYIGTDVTGLVALGNASTGVNIGSGSYGNTIGSTDNPRLRTLIAGNLGNGISMSGTHDNVVLGTKIGVDITGLAPLHNGGDGIYIVNSNNNLIGGSSSAAQNTIAHNSASGVLVQSGNGNTILHNSIYANSSAGIDLMAGANHDQAAPVLISVTTLASSIQVAM
jgi:parallel beta-helix repeat protein